jgi:hypothetical protein
VSRLYSVGFEDDRLMKNWKGLRKIGWRSTLVTILAFIKGDQEKYENSVIVVEYRIENI